MFYTHRWLIHVKNIYAFWYSMITDTKPSCLVFSEMFWIIPSRFVKIGNLFWFLSCPFLLHFFLIILIIFKNMPKVFLFPLFYRFLWNHQRFNGFFFILCIILFKHIMQSTNWFKVTASFFRMIQMYAFMNSLCIEKNYTFNQHRSTKRIRNDWSTIIGFYYQISLIKHTSIDYCHKLLQIGVHSGVWNEKILWETTTSFDNKNILSNFYHFISCLHNN